MPEKLIMGLLLIWNVDAVEIVEKEFVAIEKPIVIEGFPSVGLVGAIATEYLASKLDMREIGFMKSRKLPPVTIVKNGVPKSPIRFYAKDNIVVIVSDTAVPQSLTYEISDAIVNWALKHSASKIISLGGISHQEQAVNKAEVFAVAVDQKTLDRLTGEGYRTIRLGFLTGVFGILMLECLEKNIEAYGFLADATIDMPDPYAAAMVLEAVAKQLNIKLDTKALLETSERIREKMTNLMRQTRKSLEDVPYPSIYR